MAEHHAKYHDYHLVTPSPWPVVGAIAALVTAIGGIAWMKTMEGQGGVLGVHGPWLFAVGGAGIVATMFFWWRDVIDEAVRRGDHTPVVQISLRYGMILFIASEVMFFVAWFWAYYDVALFPADVQTLKDGLQVGVVGRDAALHGQWPPLPTEHFKSTFDPWELPLFNTLVLLTSGTTVTWAHHSLQRGDRRGLLIGLLLTILLGITFTGCQAYEYSHAPFGFSGFVYGSTFFMATGFHGFHVIIGTIFLTVIFLRALAGQLKPKHHFGFEAAAWYWHFVDVVWLFLFASIYVYGAGSQFI